MKITDPTNTRENWNEVLAAWNKVVNWSHYEYSDYQLKQKLKPLIIYLWNEKDWVIKRYPSKKKEVEEYVNKSKYIKVIADLANSLKHGGLDRKSRSDAKQTDYYGKVTMNNKTSRFMYYIKVDGNVVELFNILRGAIDEYEFFDTKQMLIDHDKSRVTNT
jgi:hypothetical protein